MTLSLAHDMIKVSPRAGQTPPSLSWSALHWRDLVRDFLVTLAVVVLMGALFLAPFCIYVCYLGDR